MITVQQRVERAVSELHTTIIKPSHVIKMTIIFYQAYKEIRLCVM